MSMKRVKLGSQGAVVSRLGLGCMGMSEFYGQTDDSESAATLVRSIELGNNLVDTADTYGIGDNEEFIAQLLCGPADHDEESCSLPSLPISAPRKTPTTWIISGRPEYVKQACDASLKRLGIRPHRPLLPASCRPRSAHRRHRRRHGRSSCNEGKVKYLGSQRSFTRNYPPRTQDSPHHRAPDRILSLEPRSRR